MIKLKTHYELAHGPKIVEIIRSLIIKGDIDYLRDKDRID